MRAFGYYNSLPTDDDDFLRELELPKPTPGSRDLLVEIKAIALNPVDVKVRMRAEPEGGSAKVLGFDASGVVHQVGSDVALFKPRDEVFYAGDITRPGTNSEFHLVDERIVGKKPTSLSFVEAAAIPLTSITAWELLFDRFGVARSGDATGTLLIVGGAGGVGSILTQLARHLTGLTIISTASRPESRAWCEEMGAHHVIDHTRPLSDQIHALGIDSVDMAAALTRTDLHFDEMINMAKPGGKIGVIDDPGLLDVSKMKRKALSLHWEFMFSRSMFQTDDMQQQHKLLNEVANYIDKGLLRTTLKQNLGPITLEKLKRAHKMQESGSMIGKIVLEWS